MRNKIDPSNELDSSAFDGADIYFTANPEELKAASFYIVAVPTPADDHKVPDLLPLQRASETLGKVLKKVIQLCMNQPFIQAVQKKIVFQFWKEFLD